MTQIFTAEDAWNGGFHEVAIELGACSDSRVLAALNAAWNATSLDGCYLRRDVEPLHQPRVLPSLDTTGPNHCLGIASLPNGEKCACGTYVIREDNGNDWLILYLPVGSLGHAYDISAYPFETERSSREWQEPVNDWLVKIARQVFSAAPFDLALIGHETSGYATAAVIGKSGIPQERWVGYLWREGSELAWYPPTHY